MTSWKYANKQDEVEKMGEQQEGRLLQLLRQMEKQGIGEDNPVRSQLYNEYLDGESRQAGVPRMGVFELTPLCNLDCKMCYVHLQKDQLRGASLLTGEQWIGLMQEAIDAGMLSAQLSGGEAMMHPDFDEIYLFLYERGIRITVMTNGILLTDKRIAFFQKYRPAAIQITLYGGSDDAYERVTGHRMYERVTGNVVKAKEIGCRLTITATPSHYFGVEDVKFASEFCKKHDLRLLVNAELNEAREETGRSIDDFDLPEEDYLAIQEVMVPKENRTPIPACDLPCPGNNQEPVCGMRCAAGRSLFCVKWTGKMQICLDIDHAIDPGQVGFAKAWKELHNFALAYPMPAECRDCAYSSICTICPVLHAKGALAGHADRRICARTKKLVEAGYRRLPQEKA